MISITSSCHRIFEKIRPLLAKKEEEKESSKQSKEGKFGKKRKSLPVLVMTFYASDFLFGCERLIKKIIRKFTALKFI